MYICMYIYSRCRTNNFHVIFIHPAATVSIFLNVYIYTFFYIKRINNILNWQKPRICKSTGANFTYVSAFSYDDNMNNVFATCISVNRNKGALRDLRANAVTLFQREASCYTLYVHGFLMHDTYIHATLLSITYLNHWIIYYSMSKRYVDPTNISYRKYVTLY